MKSNKTRDQINIFISVKQINLIKKEMEHVPLQTPKQSELHEEA